MKILLAEDYGPLRLSISERLTEAGFLVEHTADGKEAQWLLKEQEFALAILDLMLPGRSGLQLLADIRRRDLDTAVLLITARDAIEDRVKGLDMGADDYLVKPFALDEAMARVRALLRRRFGKRSTVIRVGGLDIDTVARSVHRIGEPIELTAKEFSLLELLAMRAGEVVSRGDVWEQLYDFNYERGSSNVVDVFVSNLRKKIDRPGQPSLIQTRRGQGYVLLPDA
ncbi:MAG: response regulator transcription factor [Verrucomicrobiae bacterium]|nr:response regulator transcription factor [Verrucomicrobiae bacterium]MCP5542163.1 response regulator transcription factor [Akkermansiaceae bacterium]MCP5550135.1 response regulator transcription factor [Akkermansiaceae bacterium]